MLDLLGGHVFSTWDTWLNVKPQVEANKLRVLAVLDKNNLKSIQSSVDSNSIFSVGEKYPELDTVVWVGIWAKHGTDPQLIKKINNTINQQLLNPRFSSKLRKLTAERFGGSEEDLLNIQNQSIEVLESLKNK